MSTVQFPEDRAMAVEVQRVAKRLASALEELEELSRRGADVRTVVLTALEEALS